MAKAGLHVSYPLKEGRTLTSSMRTVQLAVNAYIITKITMKKKRLQGKNNNVKLVLVQLVQVQLIDSHPEGVQRTCCYSCCLQEPIAATLTTRHSGGYWEHQKGEEACLTSNLCGYCFKISLALVNSSSIIRSIIVKGISQLAHSDLKKARGTSYPACTHGVKKLN